jgi:hypothetical protein
MKRKELIGVEPIEINSALVSAQSRKRLYWTNIKNITQPKDKNILLKDIIESGEVDRYKSYCIDANYYKGGSLKNYIKKSRRQIDNLPSKSLHQSEKRLMVKKIGNIYPSQGQNGNIYDLDGKSPTLSSGEGIIGNGIGSSNSPKICIQIGEANIKEYDIVKRVYSPKGKLPSLFCALIENAEIDIELSLNDILELQNKE